MSFWLRNFVRGHSLATRTRWGGRGSKNVCFCPCSGYKNCPHRDRGCGLLRRLQATPPLQTSLFLLLSTILFYFTLNMLCLLQNIRRFSPTFCLFKLGQNCPWGKTLGKGDLNWIVCQNGRCKTWPHSGCREPRWISLTMMTCFFQVLIIYLDFLVSYFAYLPGSMHDSYGEAC